MIKTKNILKGKFLNLSIRIGKELDDNFTTAIHGI